MVTINLKDNEYMVLLDLVEKLDDNISWNPEYQHYTENHEDWMVCLEKKEYQAFKSAKKKIDRAF